MASEIGEQARSGRAQDSGSCQWRLPAPLGDREAGRKAAGTKSGKAAKYAGTGALHFHRYAWSR